MNRNDLLLASSLMALLCAGGGALWLLWDSWEDKQALTRKNRELQASLEASRIRLENFCEYPVGALCDVETPQGSLAELMDMDMALPEPGNMQSSQQGSPVMSERQPESLPPLNAPGDTSLDNPPVPADAALPEASPSLPAPVPVPEHPSVATSTSQESASSASPQPDSVPEETSSSPKEAPLSQTVAVPLSSPNVSAGEMHPTVQELLASSSKDIPSGPLKKTWTNMNLTRDRFTFSLAGEGSSLEASGSRLDEPPCYVVVLEGLWRIKEPVVENDVIARLQKTFTNDRTMLTFYLKRMPELAKMEHKDPRTISITIR